MKKRPSETSMEWKGWDKSSMKCEDFWKSLLKITNVFYRISYFKNFLCERSTWESYSRVVEKIPFSRYATKTESLSK